MRELLIALPLPVVAASLLVLFCGVAVGVRRFVLRRCGEGVRGELVEQANNLLTGVAATFAFFIGFAISISWGAVTAAQNAVEQQAAAVATMAWELRNISDPSASTALLGKLGEYARVASADDARLLARGEVSDLPSAAALNEFEDALNVYAYGPGSARSDGLLRAASGLISSSAAVSAVANRALPRALGMLLLIVAVLVTVVMGITTVTSGRSTMVFVYVWCLIPALSLTVVLALAYPFALRSGMTLAPLRTVADGLGG